MSSGESCNIFLHRVYVYIYSREKSSTSPAQWSLSRGLLVLMNGLKDFSRTFLN